MPTTSDQEVKPHQDEGDLSKAKPNLKTKTAMKLGEKRAREVASSDSKIYELRIALQNTKVWRVFQVRSNVSFLELHHVIQRVMGWCNCHLHMFHVDPNEEDERPRGGRRKKIDIGAVSDYLDDETIDERTRELGQYVHEKGDSFGYTYDFGDSWEHKVVLRKVLEPEQGVSYPRCVSGKLACPPEDCGGPYGYADLVDVLANPSHKEYTELREWAGDDYDPTHFNLSEVNKLLAAPFFI